MREIDLLGRVVWQTDMAFFFLPSCSDSNSMPSFVADGVR